MCRNELTDLQQSMPARNGGNGNNDVCGFLTADFKHSFSELDLIWQ
jgi:hypothetical protein